MWPALIIRILTQGLGHGSTCWAVNHPPVSDRRFRERIQDYGVRYAPMRLQETPIPDSRHNGVLYQALHSFCAVISFTRSHPRRQFPNDCGTFRFCCISSVLFRRLRCPPLSVLGHISTQIYGGHAALSGDCTIVVYLYAPIPNALQVLGR